MERFQEDALRMMRAVRFAAQLDCEIEEATKEAIQRLAPTLSKISAERVRVELLKLLISPHPEMMRQLYELKITDVVLPEFSVMMQTPQHNRHHRYSVGEHTIHALQNVPPDKILRLTMLFHDVAKPPCKTTDGNGVDHFMGHPEKGAEMTRKILWRLKFDNATLQRVVALVKIHDNKPSLRPVRIRKAIVQDGLEQYPNLFVVKRADIRAQSDYQREEKLAYVDSYEAVYEQILKNGDCLSLKEMAVKGEDLIAWGMKPGKEIGVVLNQMFQEVLEHPEHNNEEYLEKRFLQGAYF